MHNSKLRIHKDLLHSNTKRVRASTARVLLIGGLDPAGHAGLSADLASLTMAGAQAQVLCTTLTIQTRSTWGGARTVAPAWLQRQLQALLDEPPPDAVKIGACGSDGAARVIAAHLQALRARSPALPVVLDPVLRSSSGGRLVGLKPLSRLLPYCSLLTPNRAEWDIVRRLPGAQSGARLITDAAPGACLQQGDRTLQTYTYTRRPQEWRGTGCTLATLLAVALGTGWELPAACDWALQSLQDWIHHSPPEILQRTPLQ